MLSTLGICLSLAATPAAPPLFVPVQQFTLAWTHSIEKTRWEEDYTVGTLPGGKSPVLLPGAARIMGSAAGMEPPAGAVLRPGGWYEYQPDTGPLAILRLTRSVYTDDYEWCEKGVCKPLGQLLPSDGGTSLLQACLGPD